MPQTESTPRKWEEIEPEHREELDRQYLKELEDWGEPGLSETAVQTYLDYRHQRPDAAITTYEEGQIKKLLHGLSDPTQAPDPVEQEEHLDALERFGAKRLHFTNMQTYVVAVFVVAMAAIAVWLVSMLW